MKTILIVLLLGLALTQSNFFQKNGHKPACNDSSQCGSGQACNSLGLCTKICASHPDCQNPNMWCDFSTAPYTCRQRGCVHQLDCVGPSICMGIGDQPWSSYYCTNVSWACTSDNHCSSGEKCVIDTGRCEQACSSNAGCGSGKTCNANGVCYELAVTCSQDSDCSSGKICNTWAGICANDHTKCGALAADQNNPYDICAEGEYCMGYPNRCAPPCSSHQDCWYYPNTECQFRPTASRCLPKHCLKDEDCEDRFGVSVCSRYDGTGTCSQQLKICPNDPGQMCLA